MRRLGFLSEEDFKFLKVLRFDFLKRARRFFEKQPRRHSVVKKEPRIASRNEDLKDRIDNHTTCYEPTNIINTRDSLFWRWRRVKEYCRDFLVREDNGEAKEVYALMHS